MEILVVLLWLVELADAVDGMCIMFRGARRLSVRLAGRLLG